MTYARGRKQRPRSVSLAGAAGLLLPPAMHRSSRKILHWLAPPTLVALLGACGAPGHVAARARDRILTAERLAATLSQWRRPTLDTNLARQVADWWVDYQLFARQVAAGDSMLDSTTVLEVMWPEARAYVLARWREQLFASQLPLDSASLDSVYQAGDYRLMQHVLLQAPHRGPLDVRARARRRAEALRAQLARGLSWDAAQRQNDDVAARRQRGSVGIVTRGQTEPGFEQAAFALEPGGISPVIETSFGFHIARRPPLDEVRAEFGAAVEPMMAERLDSLHIRQLRERWHLTLRPGGLERANTAVRDPLRYKESGTEFARFEGGQFTLADLVRWLQAVPDWMHIQVERHPEEHLTPFLDMMMGYELLYREALDHGVTASPAEVAEMKKDLAGRLNQVQGALGVYPPAPGDSSTEELRRRRAEAVDQYLSTLSSNWQRFARVPPLLADRLRRHARWAVYPRGIRRSVQRATELGAAADSTPGRL